MRTTKTWVSLVLFARIFIALDVGQCIVPISPSRSGQSSVCGLSCSSTTDVLDVASILNEEERCRLSTLVHERAEARALGDYATADNLKEAIYESVFLPEGVELQIRDVPRKEGGGSTWKLVRDTALIEPMKGQTVLQLAHAALGLAIASSEGQSRGSSQDLDKLVQQAKERMEQRECVQLELRGRKAADAAFWFALAGATDCDLFESLTEICAKELKRYGTRSSCRAKDIWHVLERLAAAGIRADTAVEQAALTALASKNEGVMYGVNASDLLSFHSDRCLLMIWKFSTRQRKQRAFLQSALQHWEQQHGKVDDKDTVGAPVSRDYFNNDVYRGELEWSDIFKDPTRPLIIDIGCGMGVSLLGLAQCEGDESFSLGVDLLDCNFAGVDLSGLAIGYARGLSHRWGLDDRLQFFVDNAESFVEWVVDSYPGQVRFCLVQFPTPYRLQLAGDKSMSDQRGNSQLPSDATSGFMVTERLLGLIGKVLCRDGEPGSLLIQSNCEDVAVFMRQLACDRAGFACIESNVNDDKLEMKQESPIKRERIPKRTLDWISMGGERAEGRGWSTRPILPLVGRTETEVACMVNGTPVHRSLLRVGLKDE